MLPAVGRPATSWVHYTTSCNTQSSAPEDGQNDYPKHIELNGIINKPLLLHLVGYLYYLYKWCTVKQISDNEIYLLIKYIKCVLWRVAKCLSYIEETRCLKVNYAKHGACLRKVLLTDVYRNLTSLWIKPRERAFKQFKSPVLNVLIGKRKGKCNNNYSGFECVNIAVFGLRCQVEKCASFYSPISSALRYGF